jgi:hypothetical protein
MDYLLLLGHLIQVLHISKIISLLLEEKVLIVVNIIFFYFLLNSLFLDGEKVPLNDAWIYNTINKIWSEIKVPNSDIFEARFCHSATLIGERIFVYGGIILYIINNIKNYYY